MPVATKTPDTRSRLVEAARELFYEKGYRATSLATVAERAGANPGSLYYFFKTKEVLLESVLERYVELLQPMIVTPAFSATLDPIERIFAVLGGYRAMLVRTQFRTGCPIGDLALELQDAPPRIQNRIAENFDNWTGVIEQCLDQAGQRLPADLDRRGLARFVLTTMEGAVLQARGHRSIEPFDDSVRQLRDYFNRLLEDPAPGAWRPPEPLSEDSP